MPTAYRAAAGACGLLLCVCGAFTDPTPSYTPPAEPDIELSVAKATFVEGEPVGIKVVIRNRSALPMWFPEYPDFQFELEQRPPAWRPVFWFTSATVRMDPLPWMSYCRCNHQSARGRTVLPGRRYDSVIYLQRFATPPGVGTHEITCDARMLVCWEDPTFGGPDALESRRARSLQGKGTLRFVVRPARPGELERIAARYAARLKSYDDFAHEALCLMDHPAVIPHLPELIAYPSYTGQTWLALESYAKNEEARTVLRKALATAGERERYLLFRVLAHWKCDVDVALLRKLYRSDRDLQRPIRDYAQWMGKPEYAEFLKD